MITSNFLSLFNELPYKNFILSYYMRSNKKLLSMVFGNGLPLLIIPHSLIVVIDFKFFSKFIIIVVIIITLYSSMCILYN